MINMKKQYRVMGFSDLMDVEMNCKSAEHASEILDTMIDGGLYYKGYIMDNFTGEVYCTFDFEDSETGITFTCWTAKQ